MQLLRFCRSLLLFQFTHPRGVRFYKCFGLFLFQGFNSRTREGCDKFPSYGTTEFLFQFTHPRGVRFVKTKWFKSFAVSIHAPARGAMALRTSTTRQSRFQFTHPRGVRCKQSLLYLQLARFNSRTREGCDLQGTGTGQ